VSRKKTTYPRSQRKRVARRRQLLEEALAISSNVGPRALTMQELATRLDYTPGAVYRYFASRDELLHALRDFALEEITGRYDQLLARLTADERVKRAAPRPSALLMLLAMARFYVRLLDELPEHLSLINYFMGDAQRAFEEERPGPLLSVLDRIARLFEEAHRVGALEQADARERALDFWASLLGVTQLEKLHRTFDAQFDPRKVGPRIATTLLQGWRADGADLKLAIALLVELTSNEA